MNEIELLAQRFEANRAHLRSVAYRMLGSHSEADDAVQEAWLRLSRADAGTVENLTGWLTTVVGRVCLDLLRTRKMRHEEAIGTEAERVANDDNAERDIVLADSIGMAMLAVLDTLSPPERVTFVLHDMFNLPFEDIAIIVGRSPVAARQLLGRHKHHQYWHQHFRLGTGIIRRARRGFSERHIPRIADEMGKLLILSPNDGRSRSHRHWRDARALCCLPA